MSCNLIGPFLNGVLVAMVTANQVLAKLKKSVQSWLAVHKVDDKFFEPVLHHL
jgi:hypothetical protein